MKHGVLPGFIFATGAVAFAVGLTWQWRELQVLRAERDAIRWEKGERDRLQAENGKLRTNQISEAELAVLRADHSALPRLRAELEALKTASGAPSL